MAKRLLISEHAARVAQLQAAEAEASAAHAAHVRAHTAGLVQQAAGQPIPPDQLIPPEIRASQLALLKLRDRLARTRRDYERALAKANREYLADPASYNPTGPAPSLSDQ